LPVERDKLRNAKDHVFALLKFFVVKNTKNTWDGDSSVVCVRLSIGRFGVRPKVTEWIAVAVLGQERSPQTPGKKQISGSDLPPIAVTKIKCKKYQATTDL